MWWIVAAFVVGAVSGLASFNSIAGWWSMQRNGLARVVQHRDPKRARRPRAVAVEQGEFDDTSAL